MKKGGIVPIVVLVGIALVLTLAVVDKGGSPTGLQTVEPNEPPRYIGALINGTGGVVLDLREYFVDPEGSELAFVVDDPAVSLVGSRLSFTAPSNFAGEYVVNVQVSDGTNTVYKPISFIVEGVVANSPPLRGQLVSEPVEVQPVAEQSEFMPVAQPLNESSEAAPQELEIVSEPAISEITISAVPTHDAPILNSTDNSGQSGNTASVNETLTVYAQNVADGDGDTVQNITDWRVNGTSIAVLNMPFETNETTTAAGAIRDYGSFVNNGTLGNAVAAQVPVWNASGKVGGSYRFDGVDDFVALPDAASLRATRITLEAWTISNVTAAGCIICNNGAAAGLSDGAEISWVGNGDIRMRVGNNAGADAIASPGLGYSDGVWHHVVGTYDGAVVGLYVDGVSVANTSYATGIVYKATSYPTIGARRNGALLDNEVNGQVDEARIYNSSLSASQISRLYLDGSQGNHSLNWLGSSFNRTDIVGVAVTPNDNTSDGTTKFTNNVTISNAPPSIAQVVLNSTDGSGALGNNATGDENLTIQVVASDGDGDSFKNITNWYLNNASVLVLNMPFEGGTNTTFVKDYSAFQNNGSFSSSGFNSTGGFDGFGAFMFAGLADTITIQNSTSLSLIDNFSVELRFFKQGSGSERFLISKDNAWRIRYPYANHTLEFRRDDNSDFVDWDVGDGVWTHLVATKNSTHIALYINGSLVESKASAGVLTNLGNNMFIGSQSGTSNSFSGRFDEIRMYNRSLSAEQISALYNNYTHLVEQETALGDVWGVQVISNDRSADSSALFSNNVTIVADANNAPSISQVILNSTDGSGEFGNASRSENLTVLIINATDLDNDAVRNITDWRINNTSIAVLNLPFEGNVSSNVTGALRDYSTRGNNASLGNSTSANAPVWTSAGQVGGAYQFDGVDEFISVNDSASLDITRGTVEAWVKAGADNSTFPIILSKAPLNAAYIMFINSDDQMIWRVRVNPGGGLFDIRAPGVVARGIWEHWVGVFDGENLRVYRNGTLVGTNASPSGSINTTAGALFLGDGTGTLGFLFNGSLDEARVYNRTLNDTQIMRLYQDGLAGHHAETIRSEELRLSDVWSVAVTPNDNQPNTDGTTVISNNVTILNIAPSVAQVVLNSSDGSGEFGNASTNETLNVSFINSSDADNDSVRNITDWRLNGTSIAVLNLPFETNSNSTAADAIRDYSVFENNATLGNGSSAVSPVWTASGRAGGAYSFTNDNIVVGDSASLDVAANLTVAAWAFVPVAVTAAQTHGIVTKGTNAAVNSFSLYHTRFGTLSRFVFSINNGSGVQFVSAPSTVPIGVWSHVAGTFRNGNLSLYINGSLANSTAVNGSVNLSTQDVVIGNFAELTRPFNGSIDEVFVFNRTLSDDQILTLFLDGNRSRHLEGVASAETERGDVWSVAVTPNDNQQNTDGATVLSNNVAIVSVSPSVQQVFLNSTDGSGAAGNNASGNEALNVVVLNATDADGDGVRNITDFRVNGTSIAVLNLPFETNTSLPTAVRDYSTFENNMTLGQGAAGSVPLWNASGKVGGAFTFDGVNDYISTDLPSEFRSLQNFTVSAWINVNSTGAQQDVLDALPRGTNAVGLGFILTVPSSGRPIFSKGLGGSFSSVVATGSLSTNTWHHIVGSNGPAGLRLYVDGVLDNSTGDASAVVWTDSGAGNFPDPAQLIVGARRNNAADTNGTIANQFFFNGSIDEAFVFNRTLSAEQVVQLYQDGLAGRHPTNIVAQETTVSDVWSVAVTPNDQAANTDGATVLSNNVTILEENSPPVLQQAIVNSTDGSGATFNHAGQNEDLAAFPVNATDVDGDQIENITDWRVGGISIAVLNMPFETNTTSTVTGQIRDYSSFGNNGTLVNVSATEWNASGQAGGAYTFKGDGALINISNTSSLQPQRFSLAAWINLREQGDWSLITKSANGSGPQGIAQGEMRSGFTLRTDIPSNSSICIVANGTAPFQTRTADDSLPLGNWTHIVCTFDGTRLRIYQDGVLANSEPVTGGIRYNGTADLWLGHALFGNTSFNGSMDEVFIFNRSLSAEQVSGLYQDGLARRHMTTLDAQETLPLEVWSVAVTPNDHFDNGTTRLSNNVTITGVQVAMNKVESEDPAFYGFDFTYRLPIVVTNGTISNITVVEEYPNGLTFLGAEPAPTSGNNTWFISSLTNQTFVINVSVNVTGAFANNTLIDNFVNVTYYDDEGVQQNLTDNESTAIFLPVTSCVYNASQTVSVNVTCGNITVLNGVTLTVNHATTANLHFRAVDNISIGSSTITAGGAGFAAQQGPCSSTGGAGHGGGSRVCGSGFMPLGRGSGGGGSAGGGAVRLTARSIVHNGTITVNAASSVGIGSSSGAGGALFINASEVLGNGTYLATGGGHGAGGTGGAGGRIAIHANNVETLNPAKFTVESVDGTLGFRGTALLYDPEEDAIYPVRKYRFDDVDYPTGIITYSVINVTNASLFTNGGGELRIIADELFFNGSTFEANTSRFRVNISALNVTFVNNTIIDGLGNGYAATQGPCGSAGGGGGHGGTGSVSVCDSGLVPADMGSGGGQSAGGGLLWLVVNDTVTHQNSTIDMRGGTTTGIGSDSGAGGTIFINATTVTGNGFFLVSGGVHGAGGTPGGGGRIAIHADDVANLASSQFNVNPTTFSVNGQGTVALLDRDENVLYTWHKYRFDDRDYPSGVANYSRIVVRNSSIFTNGNGTLTIAFDELIMNGSVLTANNTQLRVTFVGENATLFNNSMIEGIGSGFSVTQGPCGATVGPSGHGGGPRFCDSALYPNQLGSGGQNTAGGGYMNFTLSGLLNLSNSTLDNRGGSTTGIGAHGAAGGTIFINVSSIESTGLFRASGGTAGAGGTGGGGGRIAIHADNAGTISSAQLNVNGGTDTVANRGTQVLVDRDDDIIYGLDGFAVEAVDLVGGQLRAAGFVQTFSNLRIRANSTVNVTGDLNVTNVTFVSTNDAVTLAAGDINVSGSFMDVPRLGLSFENTFVDNTSSRYRASIATLQLEKVNTSIINWSSTVTNIHNLSRNVLLAENLVRVNSSAVAGLNDTANITLYGVTAAGVPVIIMDVLDTGDFVGCPSSRCTLQSYQDGVLRFNVSRFTSYSSSEGIFLEKNDSPDPVSRGSTLSYTLFINNSDGNITNVTLVEIYPTHVAFNGSQPAPNVSNDTFFLPDLASNQTFQVNITVNVSSALTAGFVMNNTANLTFNNASGSSFFVNVTEATTIANVGPSIAQVILNSSDGSGEVSNVATDDENLTVIVINATDPDNQSIQNITDWRVDGISIAVLNLPFESNVSVNASNALRDYSTNQNNGTLGNGTVAAVPVWNASGRAGGSYSFDGVNDFISTTYTTSVGTNPYTYAAWIKAPNANQLSAIIAKRPAANNQLALYMCGDVSCSTAGQRLNAFERDTADRAAFGAVDIADNQWHHVVLTRDNSAIRAYVDGVLDAQTVAASRNVISTQRITIGNADNTYAGDEFNGQIDEVLVFDRSLSAQQVYALFLDGNRSRHPETFVSEETAIGDVWSVAVTPNDNAPNTDGATVLSNSVTIVSNNSAPSIAQAILNSTDGSGYTANTSSTSENLTVFVINATDANGDTVQNITDWRVNGTSIAVLNLPFETNSSSLAAGAIRDYSTFNNSGRLGGGNASKAPVWNSSGRVGGAYTFDGSDDFINLSAPTMSLTTRGSLEAWYNASTLVSGNNYFLIAKGDMTGANAAANYQLVVHAASTDLLFCSVGNGTASQILFSTAVSAVGTFVHVVCAWDTTASNISVYINGVLDNSSAMTLTPAANAFSLTVGGTGANAGGASGAMNGSIDEVRVYNRSLSGSQVAQLYQDGLAGSHMMSLVHNETGITDVWSVAVTPNDNAPNTDGATVLSNSVTIVSNNSAPSIAQAILNSTDGSGYTANTSSTSENLTVFVINATDANGDTIQNITDWRVNGTSIAVLNMPFETNLSLSTSGAVRDYSTFGNNGTLGNGTSSVSLPVWNSSGKVGGAYSFDGTDDIVRVPSAFNNLTSGAIELWFNAESFPSVNVSKKIFAASNSSSGTSFLTVGITNVAGTNFLELIVRNTTNFSIHGYGNTSLALDTWHHAVAQQTGSGYELYVDGVPQTISLISSRGSPNNTDWFSYVPGINSTVIGGLVASAVLAQPWNGSIDEVRVYNRSLSGSQVAQLYQDGLAGRHMTSLVHNETGISDVWSVAVTPNDNAPNTDGATVLSNNVTILADDVNQTEAATVKIDSPDPLNLTATTLLNYSITFNLTNGSASNVTFNESYPANVSFVNATPSPTLGNFSWDAGNLTAPYVFNISILINVSASFANGTLLNNSVNVSFNNGTGAFIMQNATAQTTLINEQICPYSITTSTTLAQNVSCPATAFNILADNVVLDCAGFSVVFDTAGGGFDAGVNATNRTNVTVRNCVISDANASGTQGIGVQLLGTNESVVENNTVQTNGTSNNHGVNVAASGPMARNVTIENNIIRVQGTTSTNIGVVLGVVSSAVVSNNSIQTNGTTLNDGVSITGAANSTVESNVIRTQGTIGNIGVRVSSSQTGNQILNNTVFTNGTNENYGIHFFGAGSGNTVANNVIAANGSNGYALGVVETTGTQFFNNTLNDSQSWIYSEDFSGTGMTNNFTNTTFLAPAGGINVYGNFSIYDNLTISPLNRTRLDVTANRSFVNSTNLSFLNTSAQITLSGLAFSDPRPVVDFNDDGVFAECDPPQCIEVSFAGGVYVFNVSGFTTYAAQENLTFIINVSVDKFDSPDPVPRGGQLSYQIQINSTGNASALNVTLVETYPPNVSFVSSQPTPSSGNNTFSIGNLSPSSSFLVNITVNVSSAVANGTVLNNSIQVIFTNSSGVNSTVNESELTTVLGAPVIVSIKSDSPDPVVRGQQLNYSILINNTGDDTAFNVTLSEVYPGGVSFVSSSPVPSAGNGTFSLGTLGPGVETTINITVTVGSNVANGTILNNSVNLSFRNATGGQSSASDSELTTVLGFPVVTVTKSDLPDPVSNGSALSYTITITNAGDEVAYNVTATEGYDANVSFNNSSPAPSLGNSTFSVGNLSPGQSTTINITVNVSAAVAGVLNNTVNVSSENFSGGVAVVSAFAETTVSVAAPPVPAGGGGSGGGGGAAFTRNTPITRNETVVTPVPVTFPFAQFPSRSEAPKVVEAPAEGGDSGEVEVAAPVESSASQAQVVEEVESVFVWPDVPLKGAGALLAFLALAVVAVAFARRGHGHQVAPVVSKVREPSAYAFSQLSRSFARERDLLARGVSSVQERFPDLPKPAPVAVARPAQREVPKRQVVALSKPVLPPQVVPPKPLPIPLQKKVEVPVSIAPRHSFGGLFKRRAPEVQARFVVPARKNKSVDHVSNEIDRLHKEIARSLKLLEMSKVSSKVEFSLPVEVTRRESWWSRRSKIENKRVVAPASVSRPKAKKVCKVPSAGTRDSARELKKSKAKLRKVASFVRKLKKR